MIWYILIFLIGIFLGRYISYYTYNASKYIYSYFNHLYNKKLLFYKDIIGEFKLFRYIHKKHNNIKYHYSIIILSGLLSVYILFVNIHYLNNNILSFISLYFISLILFSSSLIDLKTKLIPDYTYVLTLPFFIILSNNINNNFIVNGNFDDYLKYLLIPFIFYLFLYLITIITFNLTDKIYMGLSDIKLLSLIMIVYGIEKTLIILFLSAVISLIFIILNKIFIKRYMKEIPFAIFIFISFLLFFIIEKPIGKIYAIY